MKMIVSKTVSMNVEDAIYIDKAVKSGLAESTSDFIQKALKIYIKTIKNNECIE